MVNAIKVQKNSASLNQPDSELFSRSFENEEEFQACLKNMGSSKERISWPKSLLFPIRTDNLKNFCQDFFLPGVFNVALKINDFSTKIFCCISFAIYDIISFPIRIITSIPRCIYNVNHSKESHPFYQYLIKNGVQSKDLEESCVHLEIQAVVEVENQPHQLTDRKMFNFIQLPELNDRAPYYYRIREIPENPKQA